VFWGWQAIILSAAISLPLGYTTSKEYAELEWPIDIAIAVVWVSYAIVFFGTLVKRTTSHIYVANWFFGAFIITVAVLHIVNNMEVPLSGMKSYSMLRCHGCHGAVVVWPQRGGLPADRGLPRHDVLLRAKQAGRPVYSYRLSIVHFWALISSTSGPVRTTCTIPRCLTGPSRWAW
jgi:cytochrome c oxidase cbb3-type subunit 1